MDYNNEGHQSGGQISQYNDATFSIMRLHEHWLDCENCIKAGNFLKWKGKLDSIWRELYPDVLRLINNGKPETKDIVFRNKLLMIRVGKAKNRKLLYYHLNERHQFLRSIQDMSGKGGKYVDQNPEAFE